MFITWEFRRIFIRVSAFWQRFFQTLLLWMSTHTWRCTFIILSTIKAKDLIMQHAKFEIYTLKSYTIPYVGIARKNFEYFWIGLYASQVPPGMTASTDISSSWSRLTVRSTSRSSVITSHNDCRCISSAVHSRTTWSGSYSAGLTKFELTLKNHKFNYIHTLAANYRHVREWRYLFHALYTHVRNCPNANWYHQIQNNLTLKICRI